MADSFLSRSRRVTSGVSVAVDARRGKPAVTIQQVPDSRTGFITTMLEVAAIGGILALSGACVGEAVGSGALAITTPAAVAVSGTCIGGGVASGAALEVGPLPQAVSGACVGAASTSGHAELQGGTPQYLSLSGSGVGQANASGALAIIGGSGGYVSPRFTLARATPRRATPGNVLAALGRKRR